MIRTVEGFVAWARSQARADWDLMLPIVGAEGSGKSSFAFQLALRLDPTFGPERMQFAGPLYVRQARRLHRGQAGVWDEVTEGGLSVETMSKENREVLKFLITCRSLNQFHLVCVPTLDVFMKYARDWRAPWYADVVHRGVVEFHQASRTSRRPGAKVFWAKRFRATFHAATGPAWEEYLRRKQEWVNTGRDPDVAIEAEVQRDEQALGEEQLAGSMGWLKSDLDRARGARP